MNPKLSRMAMAFMMLAMLAWPAATAAPRSDWPPDSIYQLDVVLTAQDGSSHGLDMHAGHPVLITMFYGSCPAVCPLLMDTLKLIEQSAPEAQRKSMRILMISIDPERDTPESLAALAKTRHIDTSRWTLARTDPASVRNIAAVLNIQYRKLPDGDFNHSTIITVLSDEGKIVQQSSVIGRVDQTLLAALAGT